MALRLTKPPARSSTSPRRGFTLLETSMALVIVGVGILALIEAHASMSRVNAWSTQSATASYLAQELRERTRRLPRHDPVMGLFVTSANALVGWGPDAGETTLADYDDVDDYDGVSFGATGVFPGPINSQGELIPAIDEAGATIIVNGAVRPLAGWTQRITVEKVEPSNFSQVRASAYSRAQQGTVPGLSVDQFPLRVTVVVRFQSIGDLEPQEMARLTWIQP